MAVVAQCATCPAADLPVPCPLSAAVRRSGSLRQAGGSSSSSSGRRHTTRGSASSSSSSSHAVQQVAHRQLSVPVISHGCSLCTATTRQPAAPLRAASSPQSLLPSSLAAALCSFAVAMLAASLLACLCWLVLLLQEAVVVTAQSGAALSPATSLPAPLTAALSGLHCSSVLQPPGSPAATPQLLSSPLVDRLSWTASSGSVPFVSASWSSSSGSYGYTQDAYLSLIRSAWEAAVRQRCDLEPLSLLDALLPSPAVLSSAPQPAAFTTAVGYAASWAAAGYDSFASYLQRVLDSRCALSFVQYAACSLRLRAGSLQTNSSAVSSVGTSALLLPAVTAAPAYACSSRPQLLDCNLTLLNSTGQPSRAPGEQTRPLSDQCPASAASSLQPLEPRSRVLATIAAFAAPSAALAVQCSSRGVWSWALASCECAAGWAGSSCQAQLACLTDAVRGVVCSGRGQCDASGLCLCGNGHSGSLCQLQAPLSPIAQGEHDGSSSSIAGVCSLEAAQAALLDVQAQCPLSVLQPFDLGNALRFNSSMWSLLQLPAAACSALRCLTTLAAYLGCVAARYAALGPGQAVLSPHLYYVQQLLPAMVAPAAAACSQRSPTGPTAQQLSAANCSSIGLWSSASSSCICPYPTAGSDCSRLLPLLCPNSCSGVGQCLRASPPSPSSCGPAAVCVCPVGYVGYDCSALASATLPFTPASLLELASSALTVSSGLAYNSSSASELSCVEAPELSPAFNAAFWSQCDRSPSSLLAQPVAALSLPCAQLVVAYAACLAQQQPALSAPYPAFLAAAAAGTANASSCPSPASAVPLRSSSSRSSAYPSSTLLTALTAALQSLRAASAPQASAACLAPRDDGLIAAAPPCEALAVGVSRVCGLSVLDVLQGDAFQACELPQCAAALFQYAACYAQRQRQLQQHWANLGSSRPLPSAATLPPSLSSSLLRWLQFNCSWTAAAELWSPALNASTFAFPAPPASTAATCSVLPLNVSATINGTAALAQLGFSRAALRSLLSPSPPFTLDDAAASLQSACAFASLSPQSTTLSPPPCTTLNPLCALSSVAYYTQLTGAVSQASAPACSAASPYIGPAQLSFLQCQVSLLLPVLCPPPFYRLPGADLRCDNCSAPIAQVGRSCRWDLSAPLNSTEVASGLPSVQCARDLLAFALCKVNATATCTQLQGAACPVLSPQLSSVLQQLPSFLYFLTHSSTASSSSSSASVSSSAASPSTSSLAPSST